MKVTCTDNSLQILQPKEVKVCELDSPAQRRWKRLLQTFADRYSVNYPLELQSATVKSWDVRVLSYRENQCSQFSASLQPEDPGFRADNLKSLLQIKWRV